MRSQASHILQGLVMSVPLSSRSWRLKKKSQYVYPNGFQEIGFPPSELKNTWHFQITDYENSGYKSV